MGKVVYYLGNSLLALLVVLLVVYGWAFLEVKLLLKSQPELFGYAFFRQDDGSLSPTFESSDIIIVQKDAPYAEGDIILYFDGEDSQYKAQRIVQISSDMITTKCESCAVNNDPIKTDNVVGKAVAKIAYMGAVVNFFKEKAVLITIGVVGAIFLVISQYLEYKPNKEALEGKK